MTYFSKVGDFVWEDLNGNGIQDDNEPGIAGVTVKLLDGYGNTVKTTTTNTNGFYCFTNISSHTYSLQFVAPNGYAFTPKDQGTNDAKDSDVDPITGKTETYTKSYTQNLTIDAGLYKIDTTAPTVSSVTYGTNDGALALGEAVTLTVNFSEAVTVAGGTPTLALNTGGTATYTSGSGTKALTFTYTPAAGQNTSDLATAATALVLNGATIKDTAGNNAILTGANSVNPTGTLVVDTTAPTVSLVTYGTNDGALALGEAVTLTVNFSEAVTVAGGTPTLALNTGGTATYTSGSGTKALTFTYTPAAGQNTSDLATAATALVLPVGTTIKDTAGNNAILTGANNVNPAGTLIVDTIAPTVALTSDKTALKAGETATISFTLSELSTDFVLGDVTVSGGTLSGFSGSGNNYSAIFIPSVNSTTPGIVSVASNKFSDAAGNFNADGAEANNSVTIPIYGTLVLKPIDGKGNGLGYEGFTDTSAGQSLSPSNPLVRGTVPLAADTYDNNADGYFYFVKPDSGTSFIQTIQLDAQGAATAPGTQVKITATNNPLLKLNYVWYDKNGNGIQEPNEQFFADSQQEATVTLNSIAPGTPVILRAYSDVIGDGTLDKQNLSFQLQDTDSADPNDSSGQLDYGDASADVTLYLTQTGFNKTAGSTEFSFDSFADSTLSVDIDGDNISDASQLAKVVRGAGILTEGAGGQTPGLDHFIGLNNYLGDVEPTGGAVGGTIKSDPLFINDFKLLWNLAPNIDIIPFRNNSGADAFNDVTPDPVADSLIELINLGLFSQVYAANQVTKNGITTSGKLAGTQNGVPLSQPAVAGNLNNTTFTSVSFPPPGFTGTFQDFVNSLSIGPTYQINITDPTVLNNPVFWSTYNPNTGPNIAVIKLPAGTTSKLPAGTTSLTFNISNGNTQGNLDLSKTAIVTSNGSPAGANITGTNAKDKLTGSPGNDVISGGNGKDVLNGWLGDDTLTGGNGSDRFVFGVNYGNDTITDFSDKIDLTQLDITAANVLSKLDTNGNGVIGSGDLYVDVVSSPCSSLKLELSYFSDLKAGLNPDPNNRLGPFNTTTTITLTGVTQLSASAFV